MNTDSTNAPELSGTSGVSDIVWLYRQKSIVAIHVLGGVVALTVPENVLSQIPFLKGLVDLVGEMLPIVRNFSIRSTFAELLQLYSVLMLLTVPYWLAVWMRWPGYEKRIQRMLAIARENLGKLFLMHFFPAMMLLVGISYFFLVRPTDLAIAPFQSSRWALAIFGPVFFCWVPASFVPCVVMPIEVLRRYWKGQ